jgi:predicted TIM-barrel fold metal-dependent hydrolase
MRIDVHAHYFPAPYLDLIDALGRGEVETSMGRRGAKRTHAEDAALRLDAMDRAGVGMQILSIATGGPYIANEIGAIIGARAANDAYAEMVQLYPQRFKAFACLPLPHVDAALAELARAFDELAMIGVGVATMMGGKTLADPAFDPVYEELNRRSGVLFVHPIGHACESTLLQETNLTWPLGAPFEDTAAALQLLQTGFVGRFPKIKVILPHLGGTLPFLVHRLDHQQDRFMNGHGMPSELVKAFWYDSVNGNPASLRCSCDTFGVDRIVFGTDYPFWNGAAHQHASDYLERAGLPAADVQAISEGNARALFGDALSTSK